ncbi:hypothetical protein ACFL1I_08665, partial [Candidatus Omnitrophota bacterium]
ILRTLLPLSEKTILTKSQNPRALRPELMRCLIKGSDQDITLSDNSQQALKIAQTSAQAKDLILVCGSLFLIGEILKLGGNR